MSVHPKCTSFRLQHLLWCHLSQPVVSPCCSETKVIQAMSCCSSARLDMSTKMALNHWTCGRVGLVCICSNTFRELYGKGKPSNFNSFLQICPVSQGISFIFKDGWWGFTYLNNMMIISLFNISDGKGAFPASHGYNTTSLWLSRREESICTWWSFKVVRFDSIKHTSNEFISIQLRVLTSNHIQNNHQKSDVPGRTNDLEQKMHGKSPMHLGFPFMFFVHTPCKNSS